MTSQSVHNVFHYINGAGEVLDRFDGLDDALAKLRSADSLPTDIVRRVNTDGTWSTWWMEGTDLMDETD